MRGGTWREEKEGRAGCLGGGVAVLVRESAVGVRTVWDVAVVVHPDVEIALNLNGISEFGSKFCLVSRPVVVMY